MGLDVEGRLIKILPEQSGEGRNGRWVKQDFVIETAGEYPKKICFATWGDKTDALKKLQEGQMLKVAFNPESREYNEKWYTDLKAWKIEVVGAGGGTTSNKESQGFPPVSENDIPPETEDDGMPF